MSSSDVKRDDGTIDYRARRKKKNHTNTPGIYRASWNRRDDENDAQFGAFIRYRDMDSKDRLDWGIYFELYPELQKLPIADWYGEFEWAERIAAWDKSAMSRLAWRQKMRKKKVTDQQGALGSAMMNLAQSNIGVWINRDSEDPLPIRDIIALAQAGAAMQRLAINEPTEIVDVRDNGAKTDLGKLSLDDLKRLRGMKEKMKKTGYDE